MAEQKQDDQHEHTYSNYVRIRDIVQKTWQRRWTIEKSGERGSGISVLPTRHDDDDEESLNPLQSFRTGASPPLYTRHLNFGGKSFMSAFYAETSLKVKAIVAESRPELKYWIRLYTCHITLIPLGKVWIQLFCIQLWISRNTELFYFDMQSSWGKTECKPVADLKRVGLRQALCTQNSIYMSSAIRPN